MFALVVVAASFGAGNNFVVSNSLMLGGMNTFSNVLTTFGLEKNPMTLAVFVPIFRKLWRFMTGTTPRSPADRLSFSLLPIIASTVPSIT